MITKLFLKQKLLRLSYFEGRGKHTTKDSLKVLGYIFFYGFIRFAYLFPFDKIYKTQLGPRRKFLREKFLEINERMVPNQTKLWKLVDLHKKNLVGRS